MVNFEKLGNVFGRRKSLETEQRPDLDPTNTNAQEAVSYPRAMSLFLDGIASGLLKGGAINGRLSDELKSELERRAQKPSSADAKKEDWEMYTNKLLRFRPRLIGSLGAYAALGNVTAGQVEGRGGMEMFRMMWFLGSSQDDLIDTYKNPDLTDQKEIAKELRKVIFGPERVFYQAAFTVIGNELKESDFEPEAKTYLRQKFADWYRFLVHQEAEVMTRPFSEMNFAYGTQYREEQNQKIGEVLVACLNGKECLNPKLQDLEDIIPKLSFRTQIIDDIADIPEDLESERPSYATGALNDNQDELALMREYLQAHEIAKMTPELFRNIAPKSAGLVEQQYKKYGDELAQKGVAGKMLASIGSAMFTLYPKFRDTMYKINPAYSNF